MAVPAYATDLVDITTSFTTNWNLISEGGGGQNAITAPETDDFIQGTESVSRNPFSTSIRGIAYDRALITVASGDCIFVWWKADVAAALDTIAGGGVAVIAGSTLTAYKKYYVAGSDTYALGGWRCSPIDPSIASNGTDIVDRGSPGTPDYDTFGVSFDVPGTGPSKGFPFKCDMIRHGKQIEVTAGEVANPATITALAAQADLTANRWGIVQGTPTGMEQQGTVFWGTAAAAVYSREANKTIVLRDTLGFTPTDFTQIIVANAATDFEWTNVSVLSLDPLNRGIVDIQNNAPASFFGCAFNDINTTTDGGSNSVWDGTVWRRCNEVTAAGGSFLGCSIVEPTVAADGAGFIYDETANPSGILDGMSFTQGANAHHAIEFGLNSPTAITLVDMDFTGFGADTTNGAALNILRTTGTVTITLQGTSQPTYKTAGALVEFATDPVTVEVATLTPEGTAVGNARVFLAATAGGGLPSGASVTIVNSGTTATVTHTAHGLSTNDKVDIAGASLVANLGTFQITVTGVNTYTYTMGSTPGASPTGTITSTFVFLEGLTNATTGIITMSRPLAAAQPVGGWGRKSSAADNPKYKQGPLTGTVSTSAGASLVAVMIEDE